MFSETLTLLYFASRIRPQCCMLRVLKSEVFIGGGGGGGGVGKGCVGLDPSLSELSGSAPVIHLLLEHLTNSFSIPHIGHISKVIPRGLF